MAEKEGTSLEGKKKGGHRRNKEQARFLNRVVSTTTKGFSGNREAECLDSRAKERFRGKKTC